MMKTSRTECSIAKNDAEAHPVDAASQHKGFVAMVENASGSQVASYSLAPAMPLAMKAGAVRAYSPALSETTVLREVVHVIDDFDLPEFVSVAAEFGTERYGYVVTPNVDHLIRYHEDASFRAHYRSADYILMDSRFAARIVWMLKGLRLPVCTGSDLTAGLLAHVINPSDRIVIVGGSAAQAARVAELYGLEDVQHHNPPMGFIKDPLAVEECLSFIESMSPFRFCFLAVGSPQQEEIAQLLRTRGRTQGLALCVGASLNFLTGVEKRAPVWMQKMALEWLYRLMQNPRRLARRYLVRGPRIFAHLRRSRVVLRKAASHG